jgi:hypothetical protein
MLQLPPLDELIARRLTEIKLWLILQPIFEQCGEDDEHVFNFIDYLCNIFKVSKTIMYDAITRIQSPRLKPTRHELVLYTKYINIPIRKICEIFHMSQRNYYHIINELETNPEKIRLVPKLNIETIEIVDRFLVQLSQMFKPILEVL